MADEARQVITIDAVTGETIATTDIAALMAPFPPAAIKKRPDNAKFTYVETHSVINRLNATCPSWSWIIRTIDWRDAGKNAKGTQQYIIVVTGELTIPGMGTRSGTGVQKVADNGGEDLIKGAASDALKKAATLFGVAIQLYGRDYEDHDTTQYEQTSRANSPMPDGSPPQSEVNRNAFINVLLREAKARGIPITAAMKPAQIAEVLHKNRGVALLQPESDGKYDKDAMLALVRSIPLPSDALTPEEVKTLM